MAPAGKDLFSIILNDVMAKRKQQEAASAASEDLAPGAARGPRASYALVVGMQASGKTSLLNVYLNPNNKDDTPRPTVALEYQYTKRSIAGSSSARDVANVWELGGGLPAADLVKVPVNAANFSAACYVIVVDLSRPADVLPALLFWTDQIKACVKPLVRELGKSDQTFAENLKARTFAKFGKDHPDVRSVKPCPVPLVIVGSKYDAFRGLESARRRVVAQALRFVAHVNGASLVFCSTKEKQLRDAFRLAMNSHLFRPAVGGSNAADASKASETHPEKPLFVTAGSDTFESILKPLPAGTSRSDFLAGNSVSEGAMAKWRAAISEFFGPATEDFSPAGAAAAAAGASATGGESKDGETEGSNAGSNGNGNGNGGVNDWPEASVDELRAQKDEALRRYRREAERRARLEKREQAEKDREADDAVATVVSGQRGKSKPGSAAATAAAAAAAAPGVKAATVARAAAPAPEPVRRKSSSSSHK